MRCNDLRPFLIALSSVKMGFDQPFSEHPHLLATIFSASGYSGSNNLGAYMSFCRLSTSANDFTVSAGELFYSVHDYSVSETECTIEDANKTSIRALILRKRQELLAAFRELDTSRSGKVSREDWGTVMCKGTGLMINWTGLLPLLEIADDQSGFIDYVDFMADLRANSSLLSQTEDSEALFNAM